VAAGADEVAMERRAGQGREQADGRAIEAEPGRLRERPGETSIVVLVEAEDSTRRTLCGGRTKPAR
jgi:hypothetical protein